MKKKIKGFLIWAIVYILINIALILYFVKVIDYFGIYTFGVGTGISIISCLVALRLAFPKLFSKKNIEFISALSNVIFAFFIFLTFYISYQTYMLNSETYKLTYDRGLPKLNVQLTSIDVPWGEFGEEQVYYVWQEKVNNTLAFYLPVYLTINNYGQVPNQLYNVGFETECGLGNKGLLSIPENSSTLIKPGEYFKMHSNLAIPTNKSMNLPCVVNFTLYNTYFDPIVKKIIINYPPIQK